MPYVFNGCYPNIGCVSSKMTYIMGYFELIVVIALVFFIFVVVFLFYKLNQTIGQKLNVLDKTYSQHLTNSQTTLVNVTEKLTELKVAAQGIQDVGSNIQSLQDIV